MSGSAGLAPAGGGRLPGRQHRALALWRDRATRAPAALGHGRNLCRAGGRCGANPTRSRAADLAPALPEPGFLPRTPGLCRHPQPAVGAAGCPGGERGQSASGRRLPASGVVQRPWRPDRPSAGGGPGTAHSPSLPGGAALFPLERPAGPIRPVAPAGAAPGLACRPGRNQLDVAPGTRVGGPGAAPRWLGRRGSSPGLEPGGGRAPGLAHRGPVQIRGNRRCQRGRWRPG